MAQPPPDPIALPPSAAPGMRLYFDPNRYAAYPLAPQATRFGAGQSPDQDYRFPFHFRAPHLGRPIAYPVTLHPLTQADVSTGPSGATKTPAKISGLPFPDRFAWYRIAPDLIDNLEAYAARAGFGHETWQGPGRRRRANAGEQAIGIDGAWKWLEYHMVVDPQTIVNGEPAVQNQVSWQLIRPIESLLITRYGSAAPRWRTTVPQDQPDLSPNSAGYPDRILVSSEEPRSPATSAATIEVKTWWVYKERHLSEIYDGKASGQNDWLFKWEKDRTPHKLLKQVWGQMHYMEVNWAVAINGEHIIFFQKRQRQNANAHPNPPPPAHPGVPIPLALWELVVSLPMRWENPRVFQTFFGFCLAGIDSLTDPTLAPALVGQVLVGWYNNFPVV